ncbi:hypothetical protein LB535_05140 [Mesorhizobium sp. CA10]|uniref:hypothetical protein n=1 Tax=Mesorhizobium sp. CA10 TaxID=588495 RepID=UPI001CCE3B38|nr:hypothetical protein [Mesorhizobium sp. CA10]MBZ9881731.1 hypothetical protein [Mesorhizobium sp. CA10]
MTDHNTAPSGHAGEAIRHLAKAIGGLTTTIRAVGSGRELHSPLTLEPLGWTEKALAEFERLSKTSLEGTDTDRTGGPSALVSRLAFVAESASQALECIAAGAAVSEAIRYALMADSHLTQFVRMIPEEEYASAIRDVWGREAMPVRLR